jgi:hypothetical protein
MRFQPALAIANWSHLGDKMAAHSFSAHGPKGAGLVLGRKLHGKGKNRPAWRVRMKTAVETGRRRITANHFMADRTDFKMAFDKPIIYD